MANSTDVGLCSKVPLPAKQPNTLAPTVAPATKYQSAVRKLLIVFPKVSSSSITGQGGSPMLTPIAAATSKLGQAELQRLGCCDAPELGRTVVHAILQRMYGAV
eukprot:TRINITY_DN4829_c0_g1_i2.p2 TRINITY_DN4829_c0_g1~~TRINITY_DN4829_c0_g1_i2.p2  ORF type:complete len:104 (+),score=2.22 TRINITY_DN4829_c0_g1_i2:585-896(+)